MTKRMIQTKRDHLKRKLLYALAFILLPLALLLFSPESFAKIEVTPGLSMSGTYDDNLYLNHTDKKSDYITTVSPSLKLVHLAENQLLDLFYRPSLVWYADQDQNDTIRHLARLGFNRQLTKDLNFRLSNTYLKSEEPLEETEDVEGIRTSRRSYQRNRGNAELQYRFGPENTFNLGYSNNLLINKDPNLDDGVIHRPYGNYTYWFNIKNGITLTGYYEKADFSRDDGLPAADDYCGFGTGLTYRHRFSPQTTGNVSYDYTDRKFDGLGQDYRVHNASAGLTHSFSPYLTLSASGGYFVQEYKRSPNTFEGFSYEATLRRLFERGSFHLGGRGGWDESWLDAEQRGFTRFNSLQSGLDYQLTANVSSSLGVSYRHDEDSAGRKWKTLRGRLGLRWDFHRYHNLSLNYSYAQRDHDLITSDYKRNQIMLIFSTSKLFVFD